MSLIDRQMAIDANCIDWCGRKYEDCLHKSAKEPVYDGCDTVAMLQKLPSESPRIIYCKDCKFYFKSVKCTLTNKYEHRYNYCGHAAKKGEYDK